MKTAWLIMLLACSLAWAQSEGEVRDIDGQIFTYQNGIWFHNLLGESFDINEEFIAQFEDDLWDTWYDQGTTTLQRILDLGPNVIFRYRGQDGEFRNYASFNCLDVNTSIDASDTETLDEQEYSKYDEIWVQAGLGPTYTLYTEFTAIYKEEKWEDWSDQDDKLERILDLGQHVVFQFQGSDENIYTYFVHNCRPIVPVIDDRPAALAPLTAAIIGGAVVVGTVIIEDNDDDDEESPIRDDDDGDDDD